MGAEAYLIDLDDKRVFDTYQGRHLFWMIPLIADNRICIDHDDNALCDCYNSQAKELEFQKIDAEEVIHFLVQWEFQKEDTPSLFEGGYKSNRFDAFEGGKELMYNLDPEMYDYPASVETAMIGALIEPDCGYDVDLKLPWMKIDSLRNLYRILIMYGHCNTKESGKISQELFKVRDVKDNANLLIAKERYVNDNKDIGLDDYVLLRNELSIKSIDILMNLNNHYNKGEYIDLLQIKRFFGTAFTIADIEEKKSYDNILKKFKELLDVSDYHSDQRVIALKRLYLLYYMKQLTNVHRGLPLLEDCFI